jgi:hypothetical protein
MAYRHQPSEAPSVYVHLDGIERIWAGNETHWMSRCTSGPKKRESHCCAPDGSRGNQREPNKVLSRLTQCSSTIRPVITYRWRADLSASNAVSLASYIAGKQNPVGRLAPTGCVGTCYTARLCRALQSQNPPWQPRVRPPTRDHYRLANANRSW